MFSKLSLVILFVLQDSGMNVLNPACTCIYIPGHVVFHYVGMLSKSKGQILRTAAVMHALFHMETPTSISAEISEAAVKAADCFVDYCLQHAAFLGGRGEFKTAVDGLEQG